MAFLGCDALPTISGSVVGRGGGSAVVGGDHPEWPDPAFCRLRARAQVDGNHRADFHHTRTPVRLLATLLDVAQGRGAEATVRRGRYLAMLAPTVGTLCLILDLHTPNRFY